MQASASLPLMTMYGRLFEWFKIFFKKNFRSLVILSPLFVIAASYKKKTMRIPVFNIYFFNTEGFF